VLADQVESIDRHARSIEIVGRAPPAVLEAISHRLGPLLGF
jgi:mRNA-degrading endonuclease toxin of MazEF toxin-antitoxin module